MKTPDGLHVYRLDHQADNPREAAFARQWAREHEYRDTLASLMTVPCLATDPGAEMRYGHGFGSKFNKFPLGSPTERDRIIAATLMQWLGSNVGLGFLIEALRTAGYGVTYSERLPDEAAKKEGG